MVTPKLSTEDDLQLDSSAFLSANHLPDSLVFSPHELNRRFANERSDIQKPIDIHAKEIKSPYKKLRQNISNKARAVGKSTIIPRCRTSSFNAPLKNTRKRSLSKATSKLRIQPYSSDKLSFNSSESSEDSVESPRTFKTKRTLAKNVIPNEAKLSTKPQTKGKAIPGKRQQESTITKTENSSSLAISNGLFISKLSQNKEAIDLRSEEEISPASITLQEIDYNCDILRNHCRWCKCTTPRLHTYLTISHKCDAFCGRSMVSDEELYTSHLKTFHRKEKLLKSSKNITKVSTTRLKTASLASKLREVKEKLGRNSDSEVDDCAKPSPTFWSKKKVTNTGKLLKNVENKRQNLQQLNPPKYLALKRERAPAKVTESRRPKTNKRQCQKTKETTLSTVVVDSNASIVVKRKRGRPRKGQCKTRQNIKMEKKQLIKNKNLNTKHQQSFCEDRKKSQENLLTEELQTDHSDGTLEHLVHDVEYVVVSDESLLTKNDKGGRDNKGGKTIESTNSEERLKKITGLADLKNTRIFRKEFSLAQTKNKGDIRDRELKYCKLNEFATLQKAKGLYKAKSNEGNQKNSSKRNSASKEFSFSENQNENETRSLKKEPTQLSQGEEEEKINRIHKITKDLYKNKSPTLKDIFGELPIKEEPPDEPPYEKGIPAEDFNRELMSVAASISEENRPSMHQTTVTAQLPLYKNFEGLLKEEPSLTNDYKTIVKPEQLDSPESPRPLHIDEEYETAGLPLEEEHTTADEENGPPVTEAEFNTNESITRKKRPKKKRPKVKVTGISFITPLKFKILLDSTKGNIHSSATAVQPTLDLQNIKLEPESKHEEDPHLPVIGECMSILPDEFPNDDDDDKNSGIRDPKNPDEWKCDLCQIEFAGFSSLADHLEQHQKDGLILCFYCQKSFGDKTSMKRHMRTHTGERPYQCKICLKRFSLPGNFKKHRDIHENVRTEPCTICNKTFRRKEHLKYHMRTHTGEKPFKCSRCGSCFTARYSLQIHMNIHMGKKPYKCSYCAKGFSDKSTMRKHIRVHTGERPFTCKKCNRCFGESGTLTAHMATHLTNRPYNCSQCALSFKTTGGLRQHQKVHYGEKQFSCMYCGMKFLQKYNMMMHERIHTGEKPYTCSHCDRCFRSRSCLGKHIVLHAGVEERKFQCRYCKKKFYRSAHLKRHEQMHMGIKPHKCDVCHKGFCTKSSLKSHTETFHAEGARSFPCEHCGKVFKRRIYVTTHVCPQTLNNSTASTENDRLPQVKTEPEDESVSQPSLG